MAKPRFLTPLRQRPLTAVTLRRPGQLIIPNRPPVSAGFLMTVGIDGVNRGFNSTVPYGALVPQVWEGENILWIVAAPGSTWVQFVGDALPGGADITIRYFDTAAGQLLDATLPSIGTSYLGPAAAFYAELDLQVGNQIEIELL